MSRLHKYFGVFVSISQGLDTPYIIREDLALSVVHCVEVTQATVMAPTLMAGGRTLLQRGGRLLGSVWSVSRIITIKTYTTCTEIEYKPWTGALLQVNYQAEVVFTRCLLQMTH